MEMIEDENIFFSTIYDSVVTCYLIKIRIEKNDYFKYRQSSAKYILQSQK